MQKNNKLQYKSAVAFLVQLIKPNKKLYLIASTISVILALTGILQAKLSQVLIDSSIALDINKVIISISVFLCVIFFNVILEYTSGICVTHLSSYAGKDLKTKICHILLYAKYGDITSIKTGDVLKTVNLDTQAVCSFMDDGLISLFSQFVMAIGALIYLLCINPKLAIVTFLYTPLGMFFTLTLNKKMKDLYKNEANQDGEALSFVEQMISQIPVIKSFAMEKKLRQKLYGIYNNIGSIQLKSSVWNALMQSACSSTSNIPRIIYIIYAGKLVMTNQMSVGTFIAIFELLNYIIGPTVYFPFLLNKFNIAIASINRIQKINAMPTVDKINCCKPYDSNEISVRMNNVSFDYSDKKSVINNFTFSHTGSGIIALCGESGSGKTTILDLLSGIYEPKSGEIFISHNCCVVLQEAYIFVDSLFANICIANKDASKEDVIRAMHESGLDELINKLEDGYNTIIGDGKRELSGGEKQRISLARAILSDFPIWILDEPTSSLDEETEKIIIATIKKKSSSKLIIMSAHRQSLLNISDRRIEMV